jgi:hypothetical protein
MTMMSTARTNLRGRLGVLIAGSLVFTALTAGAAAASVPAPMGVTAPEPIRLAAPAGPSVSPQPSSSVRPRTPVPGFLLDRGRVTTFDAPGATITFAAGLDDRGQVVGFSTSDLTGTSFSGFLRDARGRFTAINRPGAAATLVFDINDRGQLVGVAGNPDPAPSPPPASTAAMGRMA